MKKGKTLNKETLSTTDSLVGKTFNRWHVDSFAYTKNYDKYYNCTCACGTKKIVLKQNLTSGKSKSCGCLREKVSHDKCFIDRTGQKFNKLTCLSWERSNGHIYWICRCDCGNITKVRSCNLTSGAVKSCGCLSEHVNMVHGMSHTRIHGIWSCMKNRCYYEKNDNYMNYGGRGITICDEWLGTQGFINFMNWSYSHGYKDNLTIDRIDNEKGYSPDNCRWITQKEQMQNVRYNRRVSLNGVSYTVSQLASKYGIKYATLRARLERGWSVEESVELKPHIRGHKDAKGN